MDLGGRLSGAGVVWGLDRTFSDVSDVPHALEMVSDPPSTKLEKICFCIF